MPKSTALRIPPPALPTTMEDFLAHRKLKAKRTLHDQIEDIHLQLYEYDGYAKLLEGVYNEHCVEGSIVADNTIAAQMIREKAVKSGATEVAKEKLAVISKSLAIVLRRYGFGRNERRRLLPPPDQSGAPETPVELGHGTHIIKDGKVVPIENEV